MEVRWPRAPLLDHARAAIGTDAAWVRPDVGSHGRGAYVCVVDSGIDLRHRSFRGPGGETRVTFLLDVAATPRGVHPELERGGGAVWSAADIDEALAAGTALPTDTFGHGTAIASAAAGDDAGLAGDVGPRAGAAPEAGLLVVRALRDDALGFEDADVVRGVDFCFEASPSPERTVVVLALGGHDGAHDGHDPLENALAAHAARGRVVVVAAGNDGARRAHAAGRAAGVPLGITFFVPTPERPTAEHEIALVAAGAASLTVRRPDGTAVEASDTRVMAPSASGYVLVDPHARRGVHYVVLGGGGDHEALAGGRYAIEVAVPASLDVWWLDPELEAGLLPATFDEEHAVVGEEVTIPATCTSVLAIGASVSHETFTSDLGTPPILAAADGEGRAFFSSRGPSASGAPRPDVLVPGALLTVARSGDLDADRARTIFGSDGGLDARTDGDDVVLAGTSIAAGLAGGVVALALARTGAAPELDVVRAALVRSTSGPAWTAARGAGPIDVGRFLAELDASVGTGPADAARSRVSASRGSIVPGARDVVVVAHVSDAGGAPLASGTCVVTDTHGAELGRGEVAHGLVWITLASIVATPGSLVALSVTHEGVLLDVITLEVRADEGAHGAVEIAGGFVCASRRGEVAPWAVLATLGLVTIAARRRCGRPR